LSAPSLPFLFVCFVLFVDQASASNGARQEEAHPKQPGGAQGPGQTGAQAGLEEQIQTARVKVLVHILHKGV